MKKLLALLVLSLLLVGCKNSVSENDINSINKGMIKDEVILKLGEPIESTTYTKEISDSLQPLYKILVRYHKPEPDDGTSEYKKRENKLIDVENILTLAENRENLEMYIYSYKYKDSDEKNKEGSGNIYFYNGEVIFIY